MEVVQELDGEQGQSRGKVRQALVQGMFLLPSSILPYCGETNENEIDMGILPRLQHHHLPPGLCDLLPDHHG